MTIQLTPEQQRQLAQAKAAGEKRITLRWNAEQKAGWQNTVGQEIAGKEENIAHIQKIRAAARQPGFFGDVRRAIALSRCPCEDLAKEIGVDVRVLSDFRAGEGDLPSAALDRLMEVLGLRLMQEIPR